MRLRQLGTTQSVTFVAPPEVNQSILDLSHKTTSTVDSSDVVAWLLEQTCKVNKELEQLYLAQGEDFCRRTDASIQFRDFLTNESHKREYLKVLQQQEKRSLEQLYNPLSRKENVMPSGSRSPVLDYYMRQLKLRQQLSQSSVSALRSSAFDEVEQEREVAFEVQEEREAPRPEPHQAHRYPGLHATIRQFVGTGRLDGVGGFMNASAMLQGTGLGMKYGLAASFLVPRLLVSNEFARTIVLPPNQPNDNFTVSFYGSCLSFIRKLTLPTASCQLGCLVFGL
jgi:hypothetical protein